MPSNADERDLQISDLNNGVEEVEDDIERALALATSKELIAKLQTVSTGNESADFMNALEYEMGTLFI